MSGLSFGRVKMGLKCICFGGLVVPGYCSQLKRLIVLEMESCLHFSTIFIEDLKWE